MSWILGIDTASSELSIGLIKDGTACMSCSRYVRNAHAEHITRMMRFMMESNNITADDISHAAVAIGPGSFTGLRIGISFLKGFFLTHTTPILPVSSLECIAEAFAVNNARIIPVMDARQNKVFWASFQKENGMLIRCTEDELTDIQRFSISYKKNDILIFDSLGNGKSAVVEALSGWGSLYRASDLSLQRGLACARIAARAVTEPSRWKQSLDILPHYMQLSYAELKSKTIFAST